MVNLQYVIKNYKRTETLRAEHTELFKQYDDQIKEIKDLIEGRTKQLQDPQFADKREAIEKEVKRLQREMQDKTEEARAVLDKKQGDLIVLVYKEVEEAVSHLRPPGRPGDGPALQRRRARNRPQQRHQHCPEDERRCLHADVHAARPGHQPGHRQRPERQVPGHDHDRPRRHPGGN